jgi:hypothetical protein
MRFIKRWPNLTAHTAFCIVGGVIFTIASHA